MASSSFLARDASWSGVGNPAGGSRGKGKEGGWSEESGRADSQRWVKFGQEAHCGCPKMASPSYTAPAHGTVQEGPQMDTHSFKEEKGQGTGKTAGLHQSCRTKPHSHMCSATAEPAFSWEDRTGARFDPLSFGRLHAPSN